MSLTNRITEKYCEDHSDEESVFLQAISRDTFANVLHPRMLSGHLQGRLLSMISTLLQPKNILEIGTYTGYSAVCMTEGLAEGGKLTTIEANEEFKTRILKNFELAGVSDKIDLKIGNALEVIDDLDIQFDLVFIDADKMNYLNYYQKVFSKVNIGGVILSDNVLWDGKVYNENLNDTTTKYIRSFNEFLKNDRRTQKILLPVRDGLFISRKIKDL
jgi:caffeoyl-CoA O-methyltransferase